MTAYQLDMCSPSGRERVGRDEGQTTGGRTLRDQAWDRIDGDFAELRAVAREAGVSSYWLSAWLRGETEPEDLDTVGALHLSILDQEDACP